MKRTGCLLGLAVLLLSCNVTAQVTMNDWIGEFDLNQNGQPGTMVIANSPNPCSGTPWCGFTVTLHGVRKGYPRQGRIVSMDQANRRMRFDIVSFGSAQVFDAFLFAGDKSAIAGTFREGNQIFGFYAKKTGGGASTSRPAGTASTANSGRRAIINASGAVELHYPDGRVVLPQRCGSIVIFPDGRKGGSICIETQAPSPPPLPQDTRWIDAENTKLLNIMKGLVGDDAMVQNYVRSEGSGQNVYQVLGLRIDTINKLLLP